MVGPDRIKIKITPFQSKVYNVVKKIPAGQTRSYAWVAQRLGKPKAARAVGQALKRNPYPFVIPCHRVIKSDGSLGGYSQGRRLKAELLKRERDLNAPPRYPRGARRRKDADRKGS
jgi:O-6-methylguanine DNA methyltransferase